MATNQIRETFDNLKNKKDKYRSYLRLNISVMSPEPNGSDAYEIESAIETLRGFGAAKITSISITPADDEEYEEFIRRDYIP